jgi:hypothetical protein
MVLAREEEECEIRLWQIKISAFFVNFISRLSDLKASIRMWEMEEVGRPPFDELKTVDCLLLNKIPRISDLYKLQSKYCITKADNSG